jgi:hypothetical protein
MQTPAKGNALIEWLKENSHWSHWVGLVIALVGVVTGIWFAERPTGAIALKFTTVKIVQAGAPGIKIFDTENRPVTSSVFGTEILIWNPGDLPLGEKSDRIREPIKIKFLGNVQLISSVVQATINVDPRDLSIQPGQNELTIKWTQFDPGDVIKLFVVYSGEQQATITYAGRFIATEIKDISEFKEEYPEASGLSAAWHSIKYDFEHRTFVSILGLIGVVGAAVSILLVTVSKKVVWAQRIFPWVFGISLLLMVASAVMEQVSRGTPL